MSECQKKVNICLPHNKMEGAKEQEKDIKSATQKQKQTHIAKFVQNN